MPINLVYHTLEPRETQYIGSEWRSSIVTLMVIAIGCGGFCSYSFSALTRSFDDYCLLYAVPRIEDFLDERCLRTLAPNHQIEHSHHPKTIWGSMGSCSFATYCPLVQSMASMVWLALLVLFLSSLGNFKDHSWYIVFPAVVYFFLSTCVAIGYIAYVAPGLNQMCRAFESQVPDTSCGEILDQCSQYQRTSNSTMYWLIHATSGYFSAIYVTMTVQAVAYISALVVMILRCVCVTDFKLVRVTIQSVSLAEAAQQASERVSAVQCLQTAPPAEDADQLDDFQSVSSFSLKKEE